MTPRVGLDRALRYRADPLVTMEPVSEGAVFAYKAGAICLDLTITYAWHGRLEGSSALQEPRDLERWLNGAGLPVEAGAVSTQDFEDAIRLRAAIYRLGGVSAFGDVIDPEAVAVVNEIAYRPAPSRHLVVSGDQTLEGRTHRRASEALGEIAREAVELFSGEYAHRIRECDSPKCWVLFVDQSQANNRRWCAVSPCGQRVLSRDYRARKRALSATLDPSA